MGEGVNILLHYKRESYGSYKIQLIKGEDNDPMKLRSVHVMDLSKKIVTQNGRDVKLETERLTNFLLGFYDLLFFRDGSIGNELYLCQPFEGDIVELLVNFEKTEDKLDFKVREDRLSIDKETVSPLESMKMTYSVIGGYSYKDKRSYTLEDTIDIENQIKEEGVKKYWDEDILEVSRIIEYAFVYV